MQVPSTLVDKDGVFGVYSRLKHGWSLTADHFKLFAFTKNENVALLVESEYSWSNVLGYVSMDEGEELMVYAQETLSNPTSNINTNTRSPSVPGMQIVGSKNGALAAVANAAAFTAPVQVQGSPRSSSSPSTKAPSSSSKSVKKANVLTLDIQKRAAAKLLTDVNKWYQVPLEGGGEGSLFEVCFSEIEVGSQYSPKVYPKLCNMISADDLVEAMLDPETKMLLKGRIFLRCRNIKCRHSSFPRELWISGVSQETLGKVQSIVSYHAKTAHNITSAVSKGKGGSSSSTSMSQVASIFGIAGGFASKVQSKITVRKTREVEPLQLEVSCGGGATAFIIPFEQDAGRGIRVRPFHYGPDFTDKGKGWKETAIAALAMDAFCGTGLDVNNGLDSVRLSSIDWLRNTERYVREEHDDPATKKRLALDPSLLNIVPIFFNESYSVAVLVPEDDEYEGSVFYFSSDYNQGGICKASMTGTALQKVMEVFFPDYTSLLYDEIKVMRGVEPQEPGSHADGPVAVEVLRKVVEAVRHVDSVGSCVKSIQHECKLSAVNYEQLRVKAVGRMQSLVLERGVQTAYASQR
jgi:hypothetical protein